jgi:hypothetical protein
VPEHCGDGYDLDPATQFCFENMTYQKCGGNSYIPYSEFCSGNTVYAKCGNDAFNPATQACDNGLLKSIFTVFFNTSGGTPPAIPPVIVDSGAFLGSTFPTAPARWGYSFDGWFDGTQEYIASSTITKTMTLAANWTAIPTYKTIYDGNGNTGGGIPIDTLSPYLNNSTVTVLNEGTLTKTGHRFNGWSTTVDGNGPSYIAGNTFTITANTTLYAKWNDATISMFTVKVSSAGIGATGSGNYEAGKIVTISAGNAAGQKFKNWTTSSPGAILANPNSDVTTFTMPANAVTVTASFETLPQFTIAYNGNSHTGGTVPIDNNSPYVSGSTVRVLGEATLVKTNHTFGGWSTVANGSGKNYAAGNTFTVSESTTLYAKWIDVSTPTYTVTVSSAGTGASGDGSYDAGVTVSISAGTPPTGQQFKNWASNGDVTFADANRTTTTFIMPTKTVNVAALFEPIPAATYPVAVSSNWTGTNTSGSGNYAAGAAVAINAGTAPSGCKFINWTSSSNGVTIAKADSATTTFTMPANPVTVTANFETIPTQTKYTLTVTASPTIGGMWSGTLIRQITLPGHRLT